jgi:RNA polymerase sigma factor (sigma-70 family)
MGMALENDAGNFLPTRKSLLSRLKNWDDNDSWREFFETYWRLIYDVARQAGFNDAEAQDVVQETIVSVAGQINEFRYDPTKGRFKNWLRLIARRRIADQLRKKYRQAGQAKANEGENRDASEEALTSAPDPATTELDAIWDREWQKRLVMLAMERVKRRVKAEHYQIFELCAVQEWPVAKVAKALGVTRTMIYVTRHRIGGMLKKEIKRLEEETG